MIVAVGCVVWNEHPSWRFGYPIKEKKIKKLKKSNNNKQIARTTTPSHSRLLVTGSQKWTTAINREEEIISKYSHMDWSAIAWARSWAKSQWTTTRFESASTPVTTRLCTSFVSLSSWVCMNCCASWLTKSLKKSPMGPSFFTHVFFSFGASGAKRRGMPTSCKCSSCKGDGPTKLRLV